MPRHTLGYRFNLGLRWLNATDQQLGDVPRRSASEASSDWNHFLAGARALPTPPRAWIAQWGPLVALINGPLALSGLMLWPERSGVHVLLFLVVFVLIPALMLCWVAMNGLILGRSPWWGRMLLGHHDRVIATWCARQSLRLHGLFCVAGLSWLWLVLATRQVIFYWSTSIASVSERVADLLAALSLGLIAVPEPGAVAAAEAGAITGWRTALLADSLVWASWLSQVVVLWVLLPCVVLLIVCEWRLQRGVSQWPRWNEQLRERFEAARSPALGYRALQPEQPEVEVPVAEIPVQDGVPEVPGFGWRLVAEPPPGSCRLGEQGHAADVAVVHSHGKTLSPWYVSSHTVPTGDLADLLLEHNRIGGAPELTIIIEPVHEAAERIEALRHSWSVFVQRNELSCPVTFLRTPRGAPDVPPQPERTSSREELL